MVQAELPVGPRAQRLHEVVVLFEGISPFGMPMAMARTKRSAEQGGSDCSGPTQGVGIGYPRLHKGGRRGQGRCRLLPGPNITDD